MDKVTLKEFEIWREFKAPREALWKAWTEIDQLKKWWGPKGAEVLNCNMELRPGGVFHYRMRYKDQDMWGKFVYREITSPRRIILVSSFSNAQGGTTRHPMNPTWPLEMVSTFTFEQHRNGTKLTVRWSPLNPKLEEQKTFDAGHESMKKGWTGTLDRLEKHLAKT